MEGVARADREGLLAVIAGDGADVSAGLPQRSVKAPV